MTIKNQAKFQGFMEDEEIEVLTNLVLVKLASKIKITEFVSTNILQKELGVRIEILNETTDIIKNACLTNFLPDDIVELVPCSLVINKKISKGSIHSLRHLSLENILPNEKFTIEFIIRRKTPFYPPWCYFTNYSYLIFDNTEYLSNKIRIYNGFIKEKNLWQR